MLYVFRLVVENYRDKTRVLSFREILQYCKTQELYTGTEQFISKTLLVV